MLCIKRIFDLITASLLLVLLLPLLFILAGFIRLFLGPPIFFKQSRPGLYGKPFVLYKFRTMTDKRDEDGDLLQDAQRIGRFGQFLRSISFDELPELWNVIKGDMSIVGPRPLLMEYIPLYSKEQARRHDLKPGITGLAQIKGRNALTWEEKFKYDLWYIDNWSLILDVKIILKTFYFVLKREGINQEGHVTMEPFRGNDS